MTFARDLTKNGGHSRDGTAVTHVLPITTYKLIKYYVVLAGCRYLCQYHQPPTDPYANSNNSSQ
jgi:hypothetical protein